VSTLRHDAPVFSDIESSAEPGLKHVAVRHAATQSGVADAEFFGTGVGSL
jgi:hypothetical protein